MKASALAIFHQPPERFNCAQAVVHGYQTVSGDKTYRAEDFKALGGGRAPEGTCGALYAAQQVSGGNAEAITKKFQERAGANTCKQLKAMGIPCTTCVGTAAELVQEALAR